MNKSKSIATAFAFTAVLGLAACGSSGGTSAADSSTTASAASTKALADLPTLSGKSTSVKLDAGFVAGLTALKVMPGVVGTASLANGSVTFPITGGNVKYYTPNGPVEPYVQGMIMHSGSGLSLTAGSTVVQLTDFVVDPGGSMLTGKVTANGAVAVQSAPLFFLDGTTLQPLTQDATAGTATLTGTTVKLTKAAADLLNTTFKIAGTPQALPAFFTVGVATIVVNTK